MATLEKIRSKGALLVIVIGIALLAFIVGDFLNSGATYFGQSRETIAEINGESIHYTEYGAAIDQMAEVYKIETGQAELNEDIMDQLHSSVWETLINEKILSSEAEKIGLTVTPDELSEHLIGNNIHPLILQRRVFADETGRFNRTLLIQFLNSLDQPAMNDEMKTQIDQAKNYWKFWEKTVKTELLQQKYNALITKSVAVNTLDAKTNYEATKAAFEVNYIVQPYFSIPDSAVTVSNKEIKDRYNRQKENFKQEDSRSISCVVFDIKPAEEDFRETEEWINRLSDEFKTSDDVTGLVNSNSDLIYKGQNYTEFTIRPDLKNFAFNGKKNDVMGPVFENNTYTMARIMETGIVRSDSVKIRHIFLSGDDASKEDSIVGAIRRGSNFAELAQKFSAVQQTAANGGEIGWIQDGATGIDKEISEPAFSKGTNEVFTVKNAQGVQIIQIMEKTPARKKVKVAVLERKVTASSRTYSKIYNEAKQFAAESKDAASFAKLAEDSGYIVRPVEVLKSTRKAGVIPQSRQIVRWAFDNKKGVVSDVFDCGSQFVVSAITDVKEEGYRPIESVSAQLKAELIKDKKGGLIVKNISEQVKQTSDLSALASALKLEVKDAANVTFDSYQFGGAGFEPAVLGGVSSLDVNRLSAPIKGNAGVYVVQISSKEEVAGEFDRKAEIQKIESRTAYSFPYQLQQDVRAKAVITDNRLNFY
jgi:peptidyl-prolyl cis-trans isomerase D